MKTPVRYWNPLAAEAGGAWTVMEELDGKVRQLVLAADPETGHYTRLTEFLAGVDTAALGPQVHDYQEEIFIVDGDLYGRRSGPWLARGDYACRPPGEVHGPFRTENGCLVLEILVSGCASAVRPRRVGVMTGPMDAGTARGRPDTALILAAGLGSRLFAEAGLPKPLAEVGGCTLAERVVRGLADSIGIARFVVSTGHEAERVRRHFQTVAARAQVSVAFVGAEDWELGNGVSALAAAGQTGDRPFVLSMCDHLYDSALPSRLIEAPPVPPGAVARRRSQQGRRVRYR